MPSFGFTWVQPKPDLLVRPDGVTLLFVTVARGATDGRPGSRFVAVYASPDGGRTWAYLSAILSAAPDRLLHQPLLTPPRRCSRRGGSWPPCAARSTAGTPGRRCTPPTTGGAPWGYLSRIADWGGPTHLLRLADGRLLAAYGCRVPPFGVRASLSEDGGRTWGPELVLRDDGGSPDLGYPRAVQLPDGHVLVAYYFNRADDPLQCEGGVRHIAATVFAP